jgi:hypothetical protein
MKPGLEPRPEDVFLRGVHNMIESAVLNQREIVMKKAVEEFEAALRDAIGRVAINVTNYYSVEMNGSNLVITVRLDQCK